MHIFITGGTGFIGYHLIKKLLMDGYEISVLKRKGKLPLKFSKQNNITWIEGELGVGSLIDIPNCDVVIHLAAAGAKYSSRNWEDCFKTNILGVEDLIASINSLDKKPMLFYPITYLEEIDNYHKVFWNNPYVLTKKFATNFIKSWEKDCRDCKIIYGTFFQIYGANDNPQNVLPYIKDSLIKNVPAKLGSKTICRDWLYVKDLIDGIIKSFIIHKKGIHYYDFGSGTLARLDYVSNLLASYLDRPKELLQFNARAYSNNIKTKNFAKKFLPGWKPKYSLNEGILEFANKKEKLLKVK